MRQYGICYPYSFSVVKPEDTYEGEEEFSRYYGNELTVYLEGKGSELESGKKFLDVYTPDRTTVAGRHFLRSRAGQYSMPRTFSEPFEFIYRFKAAEADTPDYLGQSAKGVREFKQLKFQSRSNYYMQNYRLISYKGDLLLLTEEVDRVYSIGKYVLLFKWDEEYESFRLMKKFEDVPVDFTEVGSELESGSPDATVVDGELVIGYRCYARELNSSFIQFYRTSDPDYIEWENIGQVTVEGAPDPSSLPGGSDKVYDEYRLRLASNGETVMAVSYGVKSFTDTVSHQVKDFRTFLSFDGGESFNTKDKSYRNISEVDEGGGTSYRTTNATSQVPNYFVPKGKSSNNVTYSDYVDFSVNFDLYFDKGMGSFVLLKGGDPNSNFGSGLRNSSYLIGLKTVDDDLFQWEICLSRKLDVSMTGITDTDDAFDEVEDDEYALVVNDVCVVGGDSIHDLFIAVSGHPDDNFSNSSSNESKGVLHTEFSFLHRTQIKPGTSDDKEVVGYGGKVHPDWIFSSGLMNTDYGGVTSIGRRINQGAVGQGSWYLNRYEEPFACRWRNQLVSGFEYEGLPRAICFDQRWGTIGEKFGYEANYCRWLDRATEFGWVHQSANGGTYSYTEDSGKNNFVTTGAADTSYIEMDSSGTSPSTIERAGLERFKVRGSLKFESGFSSANDIMFLNAVMADGTNEKEVRVTIDDGGVVRLRDASGVDVGSSTFTISDLTKEYDFLLCYNKIGNESRDGFMLLMKERGVRDWNYGIYTTSISETSNGSAAALRVGVVSCDVASEIYVGDLHVSSFGRGYRPQFTKRKDATFTYYLEGIGKWVYAVDPHAEPVQIYSDEVTLHDGTEIKVEGNIVEGRSDHYYELKSTQSRNSAENVFDGIADNLFDMTKLYNGGYELILKNDRKMNIDALALVNLVGVHGFTLKSGNYSPATGTWSNASTQEYTIPFERLDVATVNGKYVVLSEPVLSESEIENYTVFVYNTGSDTYEKQLSVKENFEDVIQFDDTVGNLTGKELRLFLPSGTFDIPAAIGEGEEPYFSITFKSSSAYTLIGIGQIVLGTLVDISESIFEADYSTLSSFDIEESDLGLLFPSFDQAGNVVGKMNFEASAVRGVRDSFQRVRNILMSLYEKEQGFALVEASDAGQATHFTYLAEGVKVESQNFHYVPFSFSVFVQNYKPKKNTEIENQAPYLQIYAQKTTESAVTFKAVSNDPEGEAVTYSWDFGDGSNGTGSNPSHTYGSVGIYEVKCTATDASGGSTDKSLTVYVSELGIDTYNVTTVNNTTYFTVQIEAVDSKGSRVTHDSSMVVSLTSDDANDSVTYDGDQDGTYGLTDTDKQSQLEQGYTEIDVKDTDVGTVNFTLTDEVGRQKTFSIKF